MLVKVHCNLDNPLTSLLLSWVHIENLLSLPQTPSLWFPRGARCGEPAGRRLPSPGFSFTGILCQMKYGHPTRAVVRNRPLPSSLACAAKAMLWAISHEKKIYNVIAFWTEAKIIKYFIYSLLSAFSKSWIILIRTSEFFKNTRLHFNPN